VNFSRLQPRMTLARTLKLYKLADVPQTPGLRQMRAEDAPQARLSLLLTMSFTVYTREEMDTLTNRAASKSGRH